MPGKDITLPTGVYNARDLILYAEKKRALAEAAETARRRMKSGRHVAVVGQVLALFGGYGRDAVVVRRGDRMTDDETRAVFEALRVVQEQATAAADRAQSMVVIKSTEEEQS